MGLALWLVPRSDALSSALQSEIAQLRAANADCSGEFGLHATLLAGLGDRSIDPSALLQVAQDEVAQWQTNHTQLEVGLKNVETRGSYFQCIVVSLIRESGLLELYTAAKDAVDSNFPAPPSAQQRPDYFPHISLIYAPLTTAQAQHQIDDMHKRGVFTHTNNGIDFQGHNSVHFASLDIVDCTGKPEDWRTLHSIPL